MLKPTDVAIVGMGLTTPLGIGIASNWDGILSMQTGIQHYPNTHLSEEDYPRYLQYYGKVQNVSYPFDIPAKLNSQMKFLNRGSVLGFAAALDAIADAQGASVDMAFNAVKPDRRALYIATGDFTKVGYDFFYAALKDAHKDTNVQSEKAITTRCGIDAGLNYERLNRAALSKVNPFYLLESIANNLFSVLSAFTQFMGPNTTLASQSPCGALALELAARAIRQGRADVALAVGCGNWITEIPMYEMAELGLLSRCSKAGASFRPFDRHRDGFIPAEGGAALLLENAQRAQRRGARIYGLIRGFGSYVQFADGASVSVPEQVILRCMEGALLDAQCSVDELSFISPHGSATQKGDRSELNSIKTLLKSASLNPPICGLKPYTGHMAAASDIAETIMGILALRHGTVPATLNFNKPERGLSGLNIPVTHIPAKGKTFLSVSYGIGGQSSAVIVEIV
ncbi:MAG: hypothetical protein HQL06_11000 [Nitrospirae bacterium]|nr:hypothetical protein [Nitrospirota bacterium]